MPDNGAVRNRAISDQLTLVLRTLHDCHEAEDELPRPLLPQPVSLGKALADVMELQQRAVANAIHTIHTSLTAWSAPGSAGYRDRITATLHRPTPPGVDGDLRLGIEEARKLVPHQNATTLQVAASVLGAVGWMVEHPREGLCTPEDLDHKTVLRIAGPYLGPCPSMPTNWTPLDDRSDPFRKFVPQPSAEDVWQFGSFLLP